MKNGLTKFLVTVNVVLLAIMIFLLSQIFKEMNKISKYNTAQSTVLCGYIEDLQIQTGIDRKLSPDCQNDIDLIFKTLNK